jgi:hypothetical protein
MASDGDMYAQRKVWGYNQLCAAACDGAPTEKLVAIEEKTVRNMLSNGYAVPSLKVSTDYAYKIVEGSDNGLNLESSSQLCERLIAGIRKIERSFVAASNSSDVAKTVISVGLQALQTGHKFRSKEEFDIACCQHLGNFWLHRFAWDSFDSYVKRHRGISQEKYKQLASDACQQAMPVVAKTIQTAMLARGGRLPKRTKSIKHTLDGLKEALI